jgi:hypothetical protein
VGRGPINVEGFSEVDEMLRVVSSVNSLHGIQEINKSLHRNVNG